MQADRACYIARAADDELLDCIEAQRFASILAPRAMGKSSLMARAIGKLRAEGQLAAVVDFNQIVPRGEQVDSARWHYSIAYRICRELRIRTDLQDWWHDKNPLLSEQRLVEFFQDVVLPNTESAVTIFFDEAERAVDLPFVGDLFAALHSCYMRRVSEPDFARLNFVVLGAASRVRLCPDSNVSPFVIGRSIALADFSLAECAGLARGFESAASSADVLLERIYFWTRGQPYLTQKLARGVARRGGRLADVDAAVHDLFLAPGVSREEPLLHHMRETLTGPLPRRRHAVSMLGRLARGREVIHDPSSSAEQLLDLAGLVSSDDNGMLRFRNRIVEQVFAGDSTLRSEPNRWLRPAAVAAAALALFALLPYWYTQVLPAEAIRTLTTGTDYSLVEAAYGRLGRLPGFGRLADRLFGDAMERRSGLAATIEEARAADAALRQLPQGSARADRLLADFWLRRADAAAERSDRDTALMSALAAADKGSVRAARVAEQLIDGDYPELVQSVYLEQPLLAAAVDWDRGQAVVVDAMRRVHQWPLPGGSDSSTRGAAPVARTLPMRMTALEHVGMTRGFFVDEPGRAGAFELRLTLEHPRPSDVLVRLTAPSGAAVEIELPPRDGGVERFVFPAAAANGLARLADESITGQWEITLFDRLAGASGRLISWGLRFAGVPQNWDDAPVDGLPLPDPVRTEQVGVGLTADGRFGVAIPARRDARGAATVWDLSSGAAVADLPLAESAEGVTLLGPDRALVFGARHAALWDVRAAALVADLPSAAGLTGMPAVSADGGFFALAEAADPGPGAGGVGAGAGAEISVYRAADGERIGHFPSGAWLDWELAPAAAFIAGIDGSRRGRVFDPVSGDLLAEFFHERELVRLVPGAPADEIVAIDNGGDIIAWRLAAGQTTLTPRDSVFLGNTPAPDSIGVAAAAGGLAFVDPSGFVAVVSPKDGRKRGVLDHGDARNLETYLDPDGQRLLTLSDRRLRFWQLAGDDAGGPDFGEVSAVALAARGDGAAIGRRNGEVVLLPALAAVLGAGGTPAAATGHRSVVTSLTLNTSGALAASGGSDGVVRVWNTGTGARESYLLRHPAGPITRLVFSADDRWLVSAGPRSVRVFALADGATAAEIRVEGEPLAIAVAADSRIVAIGDSAGNIVLAAPDGSSGEIRLPGSSPITALAFADTPGLLASGSAAGDLVLWDTLAVAPLGSPRQFETPVRWLGFARGDAELVLQSGGWLHVLERTDKATRVIGSRLLPERLRDAPSLALADDGGTVRALAAAGGGRLAFAELELGRAPDLPEAAASARSGPRAAASDWRRVLGMEIDPLRGTIRRFGL